MNVIVNTSVRQYDHAMGESTHVVITAPIEHSDDPLKVALAIHEVLRTCFGDKPSTDIRKFALKLKEKLDEKLYKTSPKVRLELYPGTRVFAESENTIFAVEVP